MLHPQRVLSLVGFVAAFTVLFALTGLLGGLGPGELAANLLVTGPLASGLCRGCAAGFALAAQPRRATVALRPGDALQPQRATSSSPVL